ncbi:hypothetical protein BN126310307 [Stenotrophomonas thermophila]|nr:hypothetical protein BN126310307 [Stenotrophomonas maltophilia]
MIEIKAILLFDSLKNREIEKSA